jgi:hypothetical protein
MKASAFFFENKNQKTFARGAWFHPAQLAKLTP